MAKEPAWGDYVLATKWHDGDPLDHWCVGFYDKRVGNRHFVVDADGNQFRGGGFRRVAVISKRRGEFILRNKDSIGFGGRSLWHWRRCRMAD